MIKIIDSNDTGKTKKLLKECGMEGLFVCANPTRIGEKCRAYNIPQVEAIDYEDFKKKLIADELYNNNDDRDIYIDELEKFVNYCVPYLAGYTLTKDN